MIHVGHKNFLFQGCVYNLHRKELNRYRFVLLGATQIEEIELLT